jgi:saccharopine dehydrogenase-like NADP-dependent oxidoreductase
VSSKTPRKHKVLVVGAGRVGRSIMHMLCAEENYSVRIADAQPEQAKKRVDELYHQGVKGAPVTLETEERKKPYEAEFYPESVIEKAQLVKAMKGCSAVVSAAPFKANPTIAEAAAEAKCHYFDLTEDVKVTQFVKTLSMQTQDSAFIPQCGVAPGFITLVATHLIKKFDKCEDVLLRVGALPDQPNNRLKYNLTWSTEGLVNEYLHPCEALRDGKIALLNSLEGYEELTLDGVSYEAFNTSGGVGTLCHSYEGKIKNMTYKTIRYPGHLHLIKFLIEDLKFKDHPDELVNIFHRSIPATLSDMVIVSVRALGYTEGRYEEKTYWRKVTGRFIGRHFFTGIEVSTSAGVCGIVDRVLNGNLPQRGLIKIEDITYNNFMHSPFGRYYSRGR